jgi:GntR family transcriptional regulator, arabinose operon transcriptional repressor
MNKYEIIQQSLAAQIDSGKYQPGDKLPSEHELCARYQVSRNVVRQAMRNLEAAGMTETIKGIGTFCRDRSIRSPLTYTIGFISFFSQSYIFPAIITGTDSVLYPQGFHLLMGQSQYDFEREKNLLQRFLKRKVDGIIMEPIYDGSPERSNRQLIEQLLAADIPVVFLDNRIPDMPISSITLNDYNAGAQAAAYLTARGHRQIALFYQEDYQTKVQRKNGAEQFLLNYTNGSCTPLPVPFRGQGEASTASEAAEKLMREFRGSFSAVFCSSDEDAMNIIEQADAHSIRIPEDLSIIGFDNQLTSAHNRISLTTFAHPSRQMGRLAATVLLEHILHPEESAPTAIILDAVLIERDSVRNIS